MKYCIYCGKPMDDRAAFCSNCGRATGTAQQQTPVRPIQNARPVQTQQPVQQSQSAGWQVRSPQLNTARQAPPRKKKGHAGAILALLLVLALAGVLCFVWPGFLRKKEADPDSLINRVQVTIPNPTGPEALVNLELGIALEYYTEARMLLEKLARYDEGNLDEAEFRQLVADAVTAFENAEKISESLEKCVDLWMEADDVREKPKIKVLQRADEKSASSDPFTRKVYAAKKSASEMTAQEIVDVFDKAKNGQKIRTLATLLGTDAKHAYAQLKMAQAELEGADAKKVAEQATNCIKAAKVLKTAGTVAGLVVAAMPVATGAVATMATGELIATGGGIVMGAVNTSLELTSTGATIYYGTDENGITKRADDIADSDAMKTANLVVGLAGVGYNIKNMVTKANEMIDKAGGIDDMYELFTSLSANAGYEGSDLFGILSFGLGNLDANDGTFMGIKADPKLNGWNISIEDTKIGISEAQQEALKAVILGTGYATSKVTEKIVDKAVELIKSGEASGVSAVQTATELSMDYVDKKLEENAFIAPGSTGFDLDDYIEQMEALMEALAEYEVPETTAAETTAPETTAAATTPAETTVPATKAPTEPTKAPAETTASGTSLSGLGWIDPYAYFKVDTVFDLYPILSEKRPAAIRVRPIAYASLGPITVSNAESFVIDLTDGAITVYNTTYYEGNSIDGAYARHEFAITFTAKSGSYDMFSVSMARNEYLTKDGSLRNSDSVDKITIMNSEGWASFINDTKAFGISALRYKFLFVIEEAYYP